MTHDLHANKRPPGPKSFWPGGLLLRFSRAPLDFLLRTARTHGDIAYFRLGAQDFYLLNHPDYAREVFVTRQEQFHKGRALERAKYLFGEGLLTSEGEYHRRQRRLVLPAFHRQRLAAYGATAANYAARLSDEWRDGQSVDAAREMRRLTLLIVCKTLFDVEIETETEVVGTALTDLLERFEVFGAAVLAPAHLLRRLRRRAAPNAPNARDTLDSIIRRLIAERRAEGLKDRGDLLSMLLLARDETDGEAMSDEQVRDEVMTLFLAGHETTATALAWTWYLLAQHPQVERRLHEEIDAACAGRRPEVADIKRLAYVEMVFAESLRRYPPSWVVSRRATTDQQFGGYNVPVGALVLLSPYVAHHDARHFPDPFRFDPERFTPERVRERSEYAYFPFGGGARRCIGESFAWMEAVLILATVAQRWRLVRDAAAPSVTVQPGMVLRARGGVPLRLEARR